MLYYAHAQVEGGAEITHSEPVTLNQSGRTLSEQIQLQMDSRISRMLDKGYNTSRDLAVVENATNQLGFYRPMLAKRIEKVKNVSYVNAMMQVKLDGHRCLITCDNGELKAYSRLGKPITSIDHILRYLKGKVPEGVTLDGELYYHGAKLQTIASWVKRKQANTAKLVYYVYDVVDHSGYRDRNIQLNNIIGNLDVDVSVRPLKTFEYVDAEDTLRVFNRAKKAGYEGLIIRLDGFSYDDGKRSKSLLKVKSQIDAEFMVVDVVPSKDNWGKCVCITPEGRTFTVSAPGSFAEKTQILNDKDTYISQWLTVEFACYTADNIPFHAVALRFREDI